MDLKEMPILHLYILYRMVGAHLLVTLFQSYMFVVPISIKSRATWVFLKPHFQTLVSSFAFPQMCFTPDKQELWESDAVEFIRTSLGKEVCCSMYPPYN